MLILDVIFSIKIISSRRSNYAKACWLVVIIVFPVIGLLTFIIFGVNPLRKRQRQTYLKSQMIFIDKEDFSLSDKLIILCV